MKELFEKQKELFYKKLSGRISYYRLLHQQLNIVYSIDKLFTK